MLPAGFPTLSQKTAPRILVDHCRDVGGMIAFGEADLDPEAREQMGEQGVGGAVELRNGDDVVAKLGEVKHRIMQGGLPGADAERLQPAFERGNAAIEHVGRRIADAAVAIALAFQIEQGSTVLGAVEGIGDSLIDRNGNSSSCRIAIIPTVHRDRFSAHPTPSGPQLLFKNPGRSNDIKDAGRWLNVNCRARPGCQRGFPQEPEPLSSKVP